MRYLLTQMLLPPLIQILLLLLAWGLWRRWKQGAYVLTVASLVSLVLLSLPAVKSLLFKGLEPYPPLALHELANQPSPPQAIVILAGGIYTQPPEYGHDVPSATSSERLRYGAYVQRHTGLPVLISGGNPSGATLSEAAAMAEQLRLQQIEPRWVEGQSLNTWQNAEFSAAMLRQAGIERIVLVTSAWHLPRAVPCFEAQGLTVVPAPTGFEGRWAPEWQEWVPSAYSLYLSSRAIREYIGMVAYRVGLARP